MLSPYRNEPLTDFTRGDAQAAFAAALDKVKQGLGAAYPLVIGGEAVTLDATFESVNPARPAEVLGSFADAGTEQADAAIAAAAAAFETWQRVPAGERARYLLRAAAAMRRRKHEFSAYMVLEAGKSWVEADADTA